jgi:hypothetical protein
LDERCQARIDVHRYLPLTPDGRLDHAALDDVLRKRKDPDVIINE